MALNQIINSSVATEHSSKYIRTLTRAMSVSTVHVSVLLSVVCLGIVFVGGWYLQSSLMEVNTLVMEQHYHNQEQTKQIEELNKCLELLARDSNNNNNAWYLIH